MSEKNETTGLELPSKKLRTITEAILNNGVVRAIETGAARTAGTVLTLAFFASWDHSDRNF